MSCLVSRYPQTNNFYNSTFTIVKLAVHMQVDKLARHLLLILHIKVWHVMLLFILITQLAIFLKLNIMIETVSVSILLVTVCMKSLTSYSF